MEKIFSFVKKNRFFSPVYRYVYLRLFNKVNLRKPRKKTVGLCNRSEKIIVSLTSFPERIRYVHWVVLSILNQKYKPDLIVLWLAKSQFPDGADGLPKKLTELQQYGLSIRFVDDDIKSYKKLIPALKEYPECVIVTTDDDVYFPDYWLGRLIDSYKKNPDMIHCHAITRIVQDDGKYTRERRTPEMIGSASFFNAPLGVLGALYPPHSLCDEVMNEEKFMNIAPTNDDLWFWAMAIKNGKSVKWINNPIPGIFPVDDTQENTPCLFKNNLFGEMLLYKQLNQLVEEYGLSEILCRES